MVALYLSCGSRIWRQLGPILIPRIVLFLHKKNLLYRILWRQEDDAVLGFLSECLKEMFTVNNGTRMPEATVWKIIPIPGSVLILLKSSKPKETIELITSSNNRIIPFLTFPEGLLCARPRFIMLDLHRSPMITLFLIYRYLNGLLLCTYPSSHC